MITINIDENLIDFVTEQAANDSVTIDVWCERKLNANIKQIRREKLFDTIKADIDTYEPVVLAKKVEVDEIKRVEAEEAKNLETIQVVDLATSTEKII